MKKLIQHNDVFKTLFIVAFIFCIISPFALQRFTIKELAINLDAKIYKNIFSHSITDQVILGTNGWQYFGGELEHYLNRNPYSNRTLKNIAHNIKTIQDYYESKNCTFIATVAPNKSSLYSQNMPYYLKNGNSENKIRIKNVFEEAGVNYVDLFDLFESRDEILYFDKDSHWNDKGAALVADELCKALSDESENFFSRDMLERQDFVGDIEAMLNTIDPDKSTNYYVKDINDEQNRKGASWNFIYGQEVEDGEIDTTSNYTNAKSKTLLMYRDSFSNNLLPFLATNYKNATFTKMIPYATYSGADSVILERSERQLKYLCEQAPLFESAEVIELNIPEESTKLPDDEFLHSVEVDDDFIKISSFEGECSEDSKFFIRVSSSDQTKIYETFCLSGETDFGWQINLVKEQWSGKNVKLEVIKHEEKTIEIIHKYFLENL